jgi:hypothetical protein
MKWNISQYTMFTIETELILMKSLQHSLQTFFPNIIQYVYMSNSQQGNTPSKTAYSQYVKVSVCSPWPICTGQTLVGYQ